MSGDENRPLRRLAPLLVAVVLVFIAVVPRVVPQWKGSIENGRAVVWDPDACYHLRRAELIARNFPDLSVFDSYMNFPHGARVIWPPLYDVALAGALRAFPAPRTARGLHGPSVAVALIPPALFAATVLAVFAIARRLWPGRIILPGLAAAVTAALPASRPYTIVGALDHHAAEFLLSALFLLALGEATERVRQGGRPLRHAIVPGAALAAALLVQLTLVVLVPLACAATLLGAWRRRASALELLAWLHAAAFALVIPWSIAYAVAGAPFRYYQFGMFQPALLALAALAAIVARGVSAPGAARAARAPRLAALLTAAAIGAWLAARLAGEGAAGVTYVTGTFAAWQATIGESRSILRMGFTNGAGLAFAMLSILVLALPVACVLLARRALAGDGRRAVLLVAIAGFAVLGAEQLRFLPHLALLVGIAFATVVEPLEGRLGARVAAPLVAVGAIAALLPTRAAWEAREEAAAAFHRMRSVLEHIARATPPTSYYDRPDKTPEYGVLADWSLGHFVQYHARRPAVVDNFGFAIGDPTITRRVFLATDEEEALEVLDSLRTPLVLVEDLAWTFSGLIPDDSLSALYQTEVAAADGSEKTRYFTEAILPTLLYRLVAEYGGGRETAGASASSAPQTRAVQSGAPPLAHFRLIAESAEMTDPRFGPPVAAVKLYEVVAAAWVRLDGLAPGSAGVFRATIRTPRGRSFPYERALAADSAGVMLAPPPYPTVARPGTSYAESAEIAVGGAFIPVNGVTEEMVRAGDETRLATIRSPGTPAEPLRDDRGSR